MLRQIGVLILAVAVFAVETVAFDAPARAQASYEVAQSSKHYMQQQQQQMRLQQERMRRQQMEQQRRRAAEQARRKAAEQARRAAEKARRDAQLAAQQAAKQAAIRAQQRAQEVAKKSQQEAVRRAQQANQSRLLQKQRMDSQMSEARRKEILRLKRLDMLRKDRERSQKARDRTALTALALSRLQSRASAVPSRPVANSALVTKGGDAVAPNRPRLGKAGQGAGGGNSGDGRNGKGGPPQPPKRPTLKDKFNKSASLKKQGIRSELGAANDNKKFNFQKVGPLLTPAIKPTINQAKLAGYKDGLQTSRSNKFKNVDLSAQKNQEKKYLWTIDGRGINIIKERSVDGRVFKHTNISEKASIGGEVWFKDKNTIIINAGSGRFGDGNKNISDANYRNAVNVWRDLGYNVDVVDFGKR